MGVTARGEVAIAAPSAHWPAWRRLRGADDSTALIHPGALPLEIPAFGRRELRFRTSEALSAEVPVTVRVAANGEMRTLPLP